MKYRKLGRTGLKVSILGIGGGAFFGDNKTVGTIREVIKFGFDNGINFVDTAEDYGELKIAASLENIRDKMIISTKSFSSNKKDMDTSIRNSLKKLGIDKIEIYMMHTVDTVESLNFRIKNGVLGALKKAKSKGLIDWIGVTGHRVPALIEAIKTNDIDVVEVPYCIGATAVEELFDYAKEYDVGMVAIRALGGGILVDRNEPRTAEFMNTRNALAYVLSNKNISSVLVGMSSIRHVKENLEALNHVDIPEGERKEIEKRVRNFLGEDFCRGCLACMPCDIHEWKFGIDNFLRMDVFFSKYGMNGIKDEYGGLTLKTNACTECKNCELRCPYHVPIVNKLKNLHDKMDKGE